MRTLYLLCYLFAAVVLGHWSSAAAATEPLPLSGPAMTTGVLTDKAVVDIGVLATRGYSDSINRWQPTMNWLEQQIPGYYFRLHPLTLEQLSQAVAAQELDFVITNPGQSVLLARQYSLSWLATLKSRLNAGEPMQVGSALVVRSESSLQHLQDLRHKRLGIVSTQAFGGYLTLVYEARLKQIDLPSYVAEIQSLGFPLDNLLYRLRDGSIDAAVVPVCQLEQMAAEGLIDAGHYRVLDNQAPAGFACEVSTRLYPNWSMAKTSRAGQGLAKQLTLALLALPEDSEAAKMSGSLGWTTAVSQLAIDKLLKDLDLHPLQAPWWQRALQWLKAHSHWGWSLLALLVVLNGYHFWLEYSFSRRGRELAKAQRQLSENLSLLEHAQRAAVAGELGASLAHELNQPLAAIGNYCHGASVRLQQGQLDKLPLALEQIQAEVGRAHGIIQRLRGLLKKRPPQKQLQPFSPLLSETLTLLGHELEKQAIRVDWQIVGEESPMQLDTVAMQQLLLNLLKNAIEALAEEPKAERIIALRLDYQSQPGKLLLEVQDNGPGLKQDGKSLMQAFTSTKKDGLGLGLVICREIAESHGGSISLLQPPEGGCLVTVVLA
ncbi:PhnD/SsuA/transferrin family substrate-binding protein [Shewanella chilikensis]|uniref:sensor histidine kinase n=1 Tax=Shewanella chilikensis TaxID=558541 RepID=UPI00200C55C7|nr:PhnD/SsuA/transferrin family substrate-binding protein [Shewanella chilikensis]MCL1162715.1 PhnD/SsuA/transferrin family substrate-binding protein [Shewanella chilikensis]